MCVHGRHWPAKTRCSKVRPLLQTQEQAHLDWTLLSSQESCDPAAGTHTLLLHSAGGPAGQRPGKSHNTHKQILTDKKAQTAKHSKVFNCSCYHQFGFEFWFPPGIRAGSAGLWVWRRVLRYLPYSYQTVLTTSVRKSFNPSMFFMIIFLF